MAHSENCEHTSDYLHLLNDHYVNEINNKKKDYVDV